VIIIILWEQAEALEDQQAPMLLIQLVTVVEALALDRLQQRLQERPKTVVMVVME
jgi:hypothetical protein